MSIPLTVAAVIVTTIGVAHSYLGERYIIIRLLRRENLPRLFGSDWLTKRILRFAWHLTTLAWWGLAIVLVVLADHFGDPLPAADSFGADTDPTRTIGHVVAITLGLTSGTIAATTRGRHLAWPLFGVAAVLTWVGM